MCSCGTANSAASVVAFMHRASECIAGHCLPDQVAHRRRRLEANPTRFFGRGSQQHICSGLQIRQVTAPAWFYADRSVSSRARGGSQPMLTSPGASRRHRRRQRYCLTRVAADRQRRSDGRRPHPTLQAAIQMIPPLARCINATTEAAEVAVPHEHIAGSGSIASTRRLVSFGISGWRPPGGPWTASGRLALIGGEMGV
jgi:hypothetical protein